MTDLEGHVAAGADDRRAEPAQPEPPVPEETAAEQFQARIEELTQERDQARRERTAGGCLPASQWQERSLRLAICPPIRSGACRERLHTVIKWAHVAVGRTIYVIMPAAAFGWDEIGLRDAIVRRQGIVDAELDRGAA
jgi:hypothetical protein